MKEKTYFPNEIIFTKNQIVDKLIIILRGEMICDFSEKEGRNRIKDKS